MLPQNILLLTVGNIYSILKIHLFGLQDLTRNFSDFNLKLKKCILLTEITNSRGHLCSCYLEYKSPPEDYCFYFIFPFGYMLITMLTA